MSAEENSSLPPEQRKASEPEPQLSETLTGGDSEPAIGAPGPDPIPLQPHSKWLPPENYNVPWGWLDVFLILPLVGFVLILVFGLIVVGAEMAIWHPPPGYIYAHRMFIGLIAQILMEISLLGFFAAQIRSRSQVPFWSTIGWRPLRPRTGSRGTAYFGLILAGAGLAVVVAGASAAFPPKHPVPLDQIYANRPLTLLFMATAVLVAPLVEETIFRGYLFPVAARTFGAVGGIIFTGAVFGLLHGSQLWGAWLQIGLLMIVGIVFTFARAATRTNISSFLLHISYNGLQVFGALYMMYGPRHILHLH
ncbi:MAG: lysostaphin resistance A-like protein [Candidatus Acidiferrales bacterium]